MMPNPKRISRGLVGALWAALAASVALPLLVPEAGQWYAETLLHTGGGAPGGLAVLAVVTLVVHLQSRRWRPVTRCLLVSQALHALLILCFQLLRIPVLEPEPLPSAESRVTVTSGLPSLLESAASERVREDLLALRTVDTRSLATRAQADARADQEAPAPERPTPTAEAESIPRPMVEPAPAATPTPRVEEALSAGEAPPAPEITTPEVARAQPVAVDVPAPAVRPEDTRQLDAVKKTLKPVAVDAAAAAAATLAEAAAEPRRETFEAVGATPAPAQVSEVQAVPAGAQAQPERVTLAAQDNVVDASAPASAPAPPVAAAVSLSRRETDVQATAVPAAARVNPLQAAPAGAGAESLAGEASPASPQRQPVVTPAVNAAGAPEVAAATDAMRVAERMTLAAVAAPGENAAPVARDGRESVAPGRQPAVRPDPGERGATPGAPLRAVASAGASGSLAAVGDPGALAQAGRGVVATELATGQPASVVAEAPLDVATRAAALTVGAAGESAGASTAARAGSAITVGPSPGRVELSESAASGMAVAPARVAEAGGQGPATLVAGEIAGGRGDGSPAPAVRETVQTRATPVRAGVEGVAVGTSALPIAAREDVASGAERGAAGEARRAASSLTAGRAESGVALTPGVQARVQGPSLTGSVARAAAPPTFADDGAAAGSRARTAGEAALPSTATRAPTTAGREAVALGGVAPLVAPAESPAAAAGASGGRPAGGGPVQVARADAGEAVAAEPGQDSRPVVAAPAQGVAGAARALVDRQGQPTASGAAVTVDGALAPASGAPRAWAETDRLPLAFNPQVDQQGELVYAQGGGGDASPARATAQPLRVGKATGTGVASTGGARAAAPQEATGAPPGAATRPAPTRLLEIPAAMGGHARVAIPNALSDGPRAETYRALLAGDLQSTPPLARQKLIYSLRARERRGAMIEELGGSAETEAAVERALRWLATAQSADGRWDVDDFRGIEKSGGGGDRTDGDVGVTGLALLAYLGAGYTQDRGDFKEPIRKALDWLMAGQTAEGDLRRGGQLYSHAMATAALCEAFSLSGETQLLEPATRAVQFILDAQTPGAGWRYEPREDSDTSVTGWKVLALKSAEIAGITVPPQHFEWTSQWLDRVRRGQQGGLFAYKEGHGATPVMTAEGWFCQLFMDPAQRARGETESVSYLMENLPAWVPETRGVIHFYYWYYATLALHLSGRAEFDDWNAALRDALIKGQRESGPAKGSWDPIDQLGERGGRLYSTTMATLCLEVYYRYLPFYQAAPHE